MITCSRCNTQCFDSTTQCPTCQSDLSAFSTVAVTLRHFQENPRVNAIQVSVAADACPACQASQGTFKKTSAPHLPHEGCSHPLGCRCYYEPILDEIYP